MTVAEAGKRGGQRTREKYGPEFYQKIGKLGGQARAEELGHQGYVELGRRGGQTVSRLIERGKQGEAASQHEYSS